MPVEPIRKDVEDHFYACESCGYEGGFHVTFKKTGESKTLLVILMCPQCNQTYDIDWHIQTQ